MNRKHLVWMTVLLTVLLAVPASALGSVRIDRLRHDPPGRDQRTKRQLRAEYVVIKNTGNRARTIKGWRLRDKAGHVYHFPAYRIPAGGRVKVHTGRGKDHRGHLYWGRHRFVWDNRGDTAILRTRHGRRVHRHGYGDHGNHPDGDGHHGGWH